MVLRTRAQLAAQMEIPSYQLFQVTTILDIAFQVGFNSKATFNRAFKKQVLMTSRQYKASVDDPHHR